MTAQQALVPVRRTARQREERRISDHGDGAVGIFL